MAQTGVRRFGGHLRQRSTAFKVAAALLVVVGVAGTALAASRLIWPQGAPNTSLNEPVDLGRIDTLHGWAWDTHIDIRTVGDRIAVESDYAQLMLTDDGGRNWRAAALPRTTALGSTIHPQVQFVDADHGWFGPMPDQMLPPPDEAAEYLAANVLWRTSDGGRSWQSTDLPSGALSYGYAARVSVDAGFLLLAPMNELSPAWALYRTGDGGATWSRVGAVPMVAGAAGPPSTEQSFTQPLVFCDPSNGLLVEGYQGQSVLQTHDGGVTWTPIELPAPSDPQAVLLSVTELRAFGSRVVMAAVLGQKGDGWTRTEPVAANYPVYISDDAGRTWGVTYPYQAGVFPVGDGQWSIVDPQTWVYLYGNSNIAVTLDAGTSWSKAAGAGLPEDAIAWRPAFVSPSEGWVLLMTRRYGTFATTHDGGKSWQVSGPKLTPRPTS